MTERYLLDRDVLQAFELPGGHRNVLALAATISPDDLFLNAITVMEARKGCAHLRRRESSASVRESIVQRERRFEELLRAFADRLLPIDRAIAKVWGDMLAQRQANVTDTALATTAAVHGLVVATRNL